MSSLRGVWKNVAFQRDERAQGKQLHVIPDPTYLQLYNHITAFPFSCIHGFSALRYVPQASSLVALGRSKGSHHF